jgi:hypothetical protein
MQDNLKDILANLSTGIDQDTLLLYLQDKLSAEQKHEVEKILADNEFASDALDGLQAFSDKKQVSHMVEMLNRDLKKKTERKKQRREKMKLPDQTWIIISVVIVIILVIISYVVVHKMNMK